MCTFSPHPRLSGGAIVAAVLALAASAPAMAAPAVFTFPPGGTLRWAAVSDSTPCAGSLVLVVVYAQHPTLPSSPVEVYVDADPGTPQIVQYFAPNPQRKIPLFSQTPDRLTDKQEISIAVQSCPAQSATTLRMSHHKNPFHPNRVDFSAALRGRPGRAYRWFFGDGTQAVTTKPFVSHDYSAVVDPGNKYSYFTTSVIETSTGLLSAKRIALGSSFDLSRSMGFVQGEVKTAVTQTGQGFVVDVKIKNHHPTPIQFNRYLKQYLPCDTRQKPRLEDVNAEAVLGTGVEVVRPAGTLAPGVVTIPKGALGTSSRIVLPLSKIPPETCALGFNLIGTTTDQQPAYASFYLPVRRNPLATSRVVDARTLAALKQLRIANLLPNPTRVTGEDLYLLEQRGVIERTPNGWRRVQ